MDKNKIKTFSQKEIDHITKINKDCLITINKVEDLDYITIENFLKNPEDLKNFLLEFPTIDRFKSIEEDEKYIEQNYQDRSKAPGIQQNIPKEYLTSISSFLHEEMNKLNFCRYEYKKDLWSFYTNCLYPEIKSFGNNYIPHVDPFTYACNIFLTDIENTGTQFFKYKKDSKYYYTTNSLIRNREDCDFLIEKTKSIRTEENKFGEWEVFNGNDFIEEYHYVPARYNCVTIYKGCYWHAIKYDNKTTNKTRYSLVGAIE